MRISFPPGFSPHSATNIKLQLVMLFTSKYTNKKKGQQRQLRLISLQVLNISIVNDKTYNYQTHLIFRFPLSSLFKMQPSPLVIVGIITSKSWTCLFFHTTRDWLVQTRCRRKWKWIEFSSILAHLSISQRENKKVTSRLSSSFQTICLQ